MMEENKKDNSESKISLFKKEISNLKSQIEIYKIAEKTLQDALKNEFNDRENNIVKQTYDLISTNEHLRQEIIERKRAEDALQYRVEFESLITTLSTSFIRLSPDKTGSAIKAALKTLGEFVGVDRSHVFLPTNSKNGIKSGEYYEWCAQGTKSKIGNLKNFFININNKYPYFANKVKRYGILYFSSKDELPKDAQAEKKYFLSHKIKSFIAVPMFCKKSFIGYVGFDSIRQEKTWSVDIIALLKIVGEIFANALENKKLEMALVESEKKYKLLFEYASDAIAVLDTKGNIKDYNNAFSDLLGVKKSEIQGKHVTDFILDDDKRIFTDTLLCDYPKQGKSELELSIVNKEGYVKHVWCKATAVFDESGKCSAILTHLRDITERKKVEENLRSAHQEMEKRIIESTDNLNTIKGKLDREIEKRKWVENEIKLAFSELDQIYNSAADGIAVIDINFNIMQINSTLSQILGINKRDALMKKCFKLFPSKLCHTDDCTIRNILNGKERIEREIGIKHKNGKTISCILTATPFRGKDNRIIGIIEDIKDMTKYKKTQEDLLYQILKNKQILETSFDGFYITDSEGNFVDVNQAFVNLVEYSKDELLYMKISDLELKGISWIEKNKKNLKTFETYYYNRKGKVIHIAVSPGKVCFNNKTFYTFSVKDITKQEILERQIELFFSILDNSKEGIAITDPEGYFIYVNKLFASLHDHTPKELQGKHFSSSNIPKNIESLGIRYYNIYEANEFQADFWYSHNDRTLFPARVQNSIIIDSTGKPKYKMITIREITEYDLLATKDKIEGENKGSALAFSANESNHIIKRKWPKILNEHISQLNKEEDNRDYIHYHDPISKDLIRDINFGGVKGISACMNKIFFLLPSIAESDSTVLIQGESGTGKHLFAKAIHDLSRRKNKPFIVINCGALPDTLLESELFGYVAGAFTDARKDKPGRFSVADKGTLFLDEIGDISPAMQVRLLRFLQERTYEPLGTTKSYKIDVRIIAATNKNLKKLVEDGKFRQDLYYRINVVKLELPSLRERIEDIPMLSNHIISQLNKMKNKNITGITQDALACLQSYNYPGNIRELENILERTFVICNEEKIQKRHLPPNLCSMLNTGSSKKDEHTAFMKMEATFLLNILKQNNWNRLKTAHQLGIHKTTLFRKIKALGLKIPPNKA